MHFYLYVECKSCSWTDHARCNLTPMESHNHKDKKSALVVTGELPEYCKHCGAVFDYTDRYGGTLRRMTITPSVHTLRLQPIGDQPLGMEMSEENKQKHEINKQYARLLLRMMQDDTIDKELSNILEKGVGKDDGSETSQEGKEAANV